MIVELFAKLAGKWVSRNLQEGPMDDTKKWYLSKGVWTGVVTGLLGIYAALQPVTHLPVVPEWLFALLGAMGIYTRVTATKTIE